MICHYACTTCDKVSSFHVEWGKGLEIKQGCAHTTFIEISKAEKCKRTVANARNPWDRRSGNTLCKNGHPLSGTNLRIEKKTGYRMCRTCLKKSYDKWKAKNTAKNSIGRSPIKFNSM